jgi:hypothetical protein
MSNMILCHNRNYHPIPGSIARSIGSLALLPAEIRINGCERTPILDGVELMPHPCVYGLVKMALEWARWKTDDVAGRLHMDEADVLAIALDLAIKRNYAGRPKKGVRADA